MATQAKVIIKGENTISSAVKSASADLNALKGSVEKIGSVLKTAFSVTAIVTAIKGIGTAAKTVMTEDFGMAERAYRQLALALKDQSAYDSVVDNINRLLKEKNRLAGIMNDMAEKADSILSWNSSTDEASNPEYAEVKVSFEAAEKELKSVESQIMRIRAQRASYRLVLNALEKHSEQLESFSEDLWISLVDRMVVYSKEDIRLILKDGTEISCCY